MKIGLIARQGQGLSFDFNTGLNCSGNWVIGSETIDKLTHIYLFNRQKDESYFGGEITSYEKVGSRYKIYFRRTSESVDGGNLNWAQESAYFE